MKRKAKATRKADPQTNMPEEKPKKKASRKKASRKKTATKKASARTQPRRSPHMPAPPQQLGMSDILMEMSQSLFRDRKRVPTSVEEHATVLLAGIAWNESVGLMVNRPAVFQYLDELREDQSDWEDALLYQDREVLMELLLSYKRLKYPNDRRRIVKTAYNEDERYLQVLSLPPAPPGEDPNIQAIYVAILSEGEVDQAVDFLRKTRKLTQAQARMKVIGDLLQAGMLDE